MLEKRIDDLIKKVGTPYEMFFPDKISYKGCFFPVYEVFPDLPKFPLPSDNPEDNFDYGMDKIRQNATEIEEKDLQVGDLVAGLFNNELHVALYLGKGKIIHVFKDHNLRINRLELLRKGIKGFYRFK